jgi:hypothetical protein
MTYEINLKNQPCLVKLVDGRFNAKAGYDPGTVRVRSVADKWHRDRGFSGNFNISLLPVHQCSIGMLFTYRSYQRDQWRTLTMAWKILSPSRQTLFPVEATKKVHDLNITRAYDWYVVVSEISNTVEPRFTNAAVHEQFGSRTNFPSKSLGWRTVSRITNTQAGNSGSWEYRRGSVSC